MRAAIAATLSLWLLSAVYPAPAASLPELPSETREGITYIPSIRAIEEPDAIGRPIPDNSDHVRYDEFPSPLSSAEDSAQMWSSRSLPERLSGGDRTDFERFVSLFEERESPLGAVKVGALARRRELPFAVMPAESDRYDATVWSAQFEYALLYLGVGDFEAVVDIGALYEKHLAEGSPGAVAEESNEATSAHGFLPAAPFRAAITRFESLDKAFIDVHAKTLVSLDNPSMEPASVRLLLRLEEDAVELAGLFITRLSYPSGSTYALHLEDTGDAAGVLEEHMLSATVLTGNTTRYRLSVGEHRLFGGRFVRSASSATVWEETFPHTLVVAEQEAGLYDEPRGERVGTLPGETRVRAVEPWDRLDSRDGVDGMWYRVEAGGEQGWMWAPNLAEREK